MSVINKMLQDLDRRNAAGVETEPPARPVKAAVIEQHHGHEWFWRVIAVLVLVSVCWVAWVAYQLQPRNLATEETVRISMQPRSGAIATQPAASPGVASETPPPRPEGAPSVKAEEPKPPAETFKLAREIATPILERKPLVAQPEAKKPEVQTAQAKKPEATKPAPVPLTKVVVLDKRESAKAVSDAGEAPFQRAAGFLKQGRVSEAENQLLAALQANPGHLGARQAYVALLLEQQRVEEARRALRDAVTLHPGHPAFLLTLARVHAEQREYKLALDVMDKAGPAGESADFLTLRGAVLQRLGRHADAVGAYQKAVQSGAQPGETWTALGISLEAVGRTQEAGEAFQRALGSGRLPREVREYAETRAKALQ